MCAILSMKSLVTYVLLIIICSLKVICGKLYLVHKEKYNNHYFQFYVFQRVSILHYPISKCHYLPCDIIVPFKMKF